MYQVKIFTGDALLSMNAKKIVKMQKKKSRGIFPQELFSKRNKTETAFLSTSGDI